MLLLETFPVGDFQCNCSVLGCPDTKEAMVVDPGGEHGHILDIVKHYDLTVKWIVHTHAHLDHIYETRDVKEQAGGTISFTQVAAKITGTFSNLVLTRDGQTLVTVDAGSFQATKPK